MTDEMHSPPKVYVLTYGYPVSNGEVEIDEYLAVYATREGAEKAAVGLTRYSIHETNVN